jgi:hypothetical protein
MPRIENWSRVDRRGYEYAWKNSVTSQEVRIYYEEHFDPPYYAEVYSDGNDSTGIGETIHIDSSKRRTKKMAADWMRRHPEGV